MKLKKLILLSTSALALGATVQTVTSIPFFETAIVAAQEDAAALLQRIKTRLLEQEPIVEKQLAKVSDEDLLAFFEAASEDFTWQDIYKEIDKKYPELSLIKDDEYAKFKEVLANVLLNSEKTAENLKNVDPKELVESFDQAMLEFPEDAHAAVASFIDTIDLEKGKVESVDSESTTSVVEVSNEAENTTTLEGETLETEESIMAEGETSEVAQETTVGEETVSELSATADSAEMTGAENEVALLVANEDNEETGFRQAMVEYTDITEDQIYSITPSELADIFETTGYSAANGTVSELMAVRFYMIVTYPERFTSEQIKSVADEVRVAAVAESPMTEQEAAQIPDEDFLQWSREAIQSGGNDATYPFAQAFNNYPEVFADRVEAARHQITDNTNLAFEEVILMSGAQVLTFANEVDLGHLTYAEAEANLRTLFPEALSSTQISQSAQAGVETQTTIAAQTTVAPQTSQSASATVSVDKSTGVEGVTTASNKGALPNTGESSTLIWVIGGLLAIVAGVFLLKGRKNNDE